MTFERQETAGEMFGSEGFDLIGVGALFGWLRGEPRPSIRDLTIAELHDVLASAPPLASGGAP